MHIAEVALRVSDLETAQAFYEEMLGFTFHHEEPGVVFLEVGPLDTPLGRVGHPQLLALFDRGQELDAARSTFDHIAFEVPGDRYAQELARFQARGMVIRERTCWPETLPWRGTIVLFPGPGWECRGADCGGGEGGGMRGIGRRICGRSGHKFKFRLSERRAKTAVFACARNI